MLQDVTLKYFVRLAGPSEKNKIECGCERETERTKQKRTRRFESKERSLSKQKLVCTNMTLKFHFRVNKPTDNELRSFSSLKFLRFYKNISLIVEMFWFFLC